MDVKPFLIYFEDGDIKSYRLVYAEDYDQACEKLKDKCPNAEMKNCTIL